MAGDFHFHPCTVWNFCFRIFGFIPVLFGISNTICTPAKKLQGRVVAPRLFYSGSPSFASQVCGKAFSLKVCVLYLNKHHSKTPKSVNQRGLIGCQLQ